MVSSIAGTVMRSTSARLGTSMISSAKRIIVSVALSMVGYMQFGDLGQTLTVSMTALAITTLEGWVLTPVLLGKVAQMNRIAVFAALLFWTWVWGVWGMLLAIPITMAIKVVCDHIEPFRPVGDFLGE